MNRTRTNQAKAQTRPRTAAIAMAAAAAIAAMAGCTEPEEAAQEPAATVLADARPVDPACPSYLDAVRFDGRMLAFTDGEHFARVYGCLATMMDSDGVATHASLMRFEARFTGYQSLRQFIADETRALVATRALTRSNLPDRKYLPDSALRAMVTQALRARIGGTETAFTQELMGRDGYSDSDGDDSDGASTSSGGTRGSGCCWMYRTVERWDQQGADVMFSEAWVYNVPVPVFWFGVVGSRTRAYRATIVNGHEYLTPVSVPSVATSSPGYRWKVLTCDNGSYSDSSYIQVETSAHAAERSNWHYTFSVPFFVTEFHDSKHDTLFSGGWHPSVGLSLCAPEVATPPGTPYIAAALIQSNFGSEGNFEAVAARKDGGLQHFFRNNDAASPSWVAGGVFGTGQYVAVSLIQTSLGNKGDFAVLAARAGGGLEYFQRSNDTAGYPWTAGPTIGSGYYNAVSLIQSNYGVEGNFEAVAARASGGVQHFYRLNDPANTPWYPGAVLNAGTVYLGASIVQTNHDVPGDFVVVASRNGTGLHQFVRDNDLGSTPWSGPTTSYSTTTFQRPSLLQSNFGVPGNLELVVVQPAGFHHLFRDNSGLWQTGAQPFTDPLRDISMIQSSLGTQGDFDAVAVPSYGLQHIIRRNDSPSLPWVMGQWF